MQNHCESDLVQVSLSFIHALTEMVLEEHMNTTARGRPLILRHACPELNQGGCQQTMLMLSSHIFLDFPRVLFPSPVPCNRPRDAGDMTLP